MARFLRQAMFVILLAFLVDSTMSEAQKFIGPRVYEANDKSTLSPTSSNTAVALKDKDIPYVSASGDNEAKARKELLDFMENMNANIQFLAKELDGDGIVVVRAVKTINVQDPSVDTRAIDRDNTAKSAKPKRKSSPSRNVVSSANESPFKRSKQDQCDKKEPIPQSQDAAD